MLQSDVLNAENINDEGKTHRASVVGPEGRGTGNGAIALLSKVGGESIVGNATGLF